MFEILRRLFLEPRLLNLLFEPRLLLLVNQLLVGIQVFSTTHYPIELPEVQLYQCGVKCGRATYFLSVFIQVLIQKGQVDSIVVV